MIEIVHLLLLLVSRVMKMNHDDPCLVTGAELTPTSWVFNWSCLCIL